MFTLTVKRETSTPDEKHFPPSDALSSQLIMGFSGKENVQILIKSNLEFENIFKHAVI